ncbi:NAD(P)-dependent dehydrogenase, short-chain alcohol dehydrogenase family [Pseudomonas pohangensis]|uniref:NAD(P)-dependent dehydrogenase, short-chain alcohol dehydrogenase family n=1 Tax=Pseudomonas pohangensis TaxID=364197 RepID=A0A1H2FAJ6_9PSED|nr:SDR family NAD(P)-dependent oxidoreductase [Pseudomonas pohangensis]SDU04352.1 NAD(P)-dependent dehydrogenase, short-chain alcohol dehydrogenase family [Pseudomonas pohangensis]
MDIKGKVAIVTGGASGLGEATVRRYVALGAKVAIFDMNDERGNALAAELGDAVIYQDVNVTSEDAVQAALDVVLERFGAVHICNNFAGVGSAVKTVGRDGAFPLNIFKTVVDINLVGTFNVLRLAALQMSRQEPVTEDGSRGVIINTASIAAYEGQVGQAAYSASKGGVVGMTLPIARDLAQYGIRVNTIVPGLIHTPLFDALPEAAYESLSRSPLFPQRLGRAEEIAHLSQFIVENDYTNGECIRMDAGIRMQPK